MAMNIYRGIHHGRHGWHVYFGSGDAVGMACHGWLGFSVFHRLKSEYIGFTSIWTSYHARFQGRNGHVPGVRLGAKGKRDGYDVVSSSSLSPS